MLPIGFSYIMVIYIELDVFWELYFCRITLQKNILFMNMIFFPLKAMLGFGTIDIISVRFI